MGLGVIFLDELRGRKSWVVYKGPGWLERVKPQAWGILLPLAYVVVASVIILLHYQGRNVFCFVFYLLLIWLGTCVAPERPYAEGYIRGARWYMYNLALCGLFVSARCWKYLPGLSSLC
jgi:hypothetical protein